jgi:hypothetical protein
MERVMARTLVRTLLTTKTLIRVAFAALSIASIGVAHSSPQPYQPPAQNYHQNNWIGRD